MILKSLEKSNEGHPQTVPKRYAVLAAQVLAYLTGNSVRLEQGSENDGASVVYCDVEFEVALFILRIDDEPPPVVPFWWSAAAEYFFRDRGDFDSDAETYVLASKASRLNYSRSPGGDPVFSDQPNAWAKEISDNYEAKLAHEEATARAQWSDPNFVEDMHHANREEFARSLVDSELSQSEYSLALAEWDQRNRRD